MRANLTAQLVAGRKPPVHLISEDNGASVVAGSAGFPGCSAANV